MLHVSPITEVNSARTRERKHYLLSSITLHAREAVTEQQQQFHFHFGAAADEAATLCRTVDTLRPEVARAQRQVAG